MKEYLTKVKSRWAELASKERQAILIAGVALLIFIIYQWFWSPFLIGKEKLKRQIGTQTQTLIWMQATDHKLATFQKKTQAANQSITLVEFLGFIQKYIEQAGLEQSLTLLKQSSNESIEIHFQKVEFDRIIQLIINVVKAQPIEITQLSFIALNEPGMVSADLKVKMS